VKGNLHRVVRIPSGLFFYSQIGWVKQQGRWERKFMEGKENSDVENLVNKGKNFYGVKNYEGAIECYEKATQLDSSNDSAFYGWGNALSELAKIKQDEILFKNAFKKFEIATKLNPNNASAFNNWGAAISDLTEIKQDEILFKNAFEKFEIATKLNPNDSFAFYNWGYAILSLAESNKDESLFKNAFEKFEIAARLDPNDASAFYNWGVALYELAKIKQNEIFRKNLEIFEIKSKDIDDTDTLLIKGELYFFSNQTEKAMECFERTKKDILGILTFLDKDNGGKMIDTNFLHPLLDLDNNDGTFFKETTKNLALEQKKELDAYKEVYIRSIFIISLLHVKYDEEEFVAHYREKDISQTLLFSSNANLNKLRLNAIDYSNDLDEGKTLLDFLYGKEKRPSDKELNIEEYEAFASCFVFDYDNLNLFRLYGKENGKEGTGLSLVFGESFFSKEAKMALGASKIDSFKINNDNSIEKDKSALFRCIYIDPHPKTKKPIVTVGQKEEYLFYREKIEDKFEVYNKEMDKIVKDVREEMKDLKKLVKEKKLDAAIVGQLLINLRYLVKHIAFKEEQECRIVKILKLDDGYIKHTEEYNQLYVEYPPKVSEHINKIYFGPKAIGWELFQSMLKHNKLKNIPCEKSTNPLA
jgi:tetratricopeptide (TPR) repeat protein